jgi:hypothetical protein
MTITITPGATTATTAVLNFAGYGGDGTIDLQIASRPDFSFCVAPVISIPRGDTYTLIGLNQEATLYARARTRSAAGVLETWGATAGFRTPLATARVTTAQSIMVEPAALVFPNTILAAFSAQTIAGYPADNVGIPAPVAWRGQSAAGGQQTVTLDIVTPGDPADTVIVPTSGMLVFRIASRNANGDKTETPVGLTTTERTRTGILDRVPGIPIRRSEFDLSNLTERDFETLYGQLWRRQGDTVFCVPNSRDNAFRHDRMLLGEFGAGRISGVQGIRFTRGMSIDSII